MLFWIQDIIFMVLFEISWNLFAFFIPIIFMDLYNKRQNKLLLITRWSLLFEIIGLYLLNVIVCMQCGQISIIDFIVMNQNSILDLEYIMLNKNIISIKKRISSSKS